ncbi:MAG: hypothetical protein CDV28_10434 [Candidatus Electronema aureum]|uniref:Uncharacterized protein n=1 Tax=Candidatus Electronema aureum TaxID=2005002 RepID=A0A521G3Z7_9BACT|nr:MAG: hypothetical protein CDV28_10434 [Candidatus Electronema aureum]
MKKICIAQAGRFLLGIAEHDIIGRMSWAEAASLLKQDSKIVQLSALFAQQPGGEPQSDAICLEMRGKDESFFLVADQLIADEVEVINPPGPLPPVCPRLAARLCPQVTIWGDSAVLLLNPAQIIPVADELGNGIGRLAAAEETLIAEQNSEADLFDCPSDLPESEVSIFAETELVEEELVESVIDIEQPQGVAPTEASSKEEMDEESFGNSPGNAEESAALLDQNVDENFCVCPSDDSSDLPESEESIFTETELESEELDEPVADDIQDTSTEESSESISEQEKKETAASIDEETFKKVMTWTIACFKQSKTGGEEPHLSMEQLPPDLAKMVRQKGLSENIIQYLIDQIVLRCQESAGRRMPGEQHAG